MSASDARRESRRGGARMTAPAAQPVLVTGAAGFIGFCFARRLLESGRAVIGIDSVNHYYDPALKEARLAKLHEHRGFTFHRLDLADRAATEKLFGSGRFRGHVCGHLAIVAQPILRRWSHAIRDDLRSRSPPRHLRHGYCAI